MRKKGICFLSVSILTMAVLSACGNTAAVENNTEAVQEVTTQEEKATVQESAQTDMTVVEEVVADEKQSVGELTEASFTMTVRETTIQLGEDMNTYLETLGDPDEINTAKSCFGDGEDKTFTFGDIVIYTKPIDGKDMIYLVELSGEESLPSGVRIGSTKADVIAAYGNQFEIEGTEMIYTLDAQSIGFDLSNDEVSFIEIFGE